VKQKQKKMKKLEFSTTINAPASKVWHALWDDANYRKWTSVFGEGSHAVSDWKEGSKILFLGGEGSGMFSRISKLLPNKQMSFLHEGTIIKGVEQSKTDEWGNATENYYLNEHDGITELKADLDAVPDDFVQFFSDAFPKGLAIVKQIAEN
jgi:hypothetical protein